ncbi:MAG TPA: hypothetical protein DCS93_35560 [Microscillaceae bacterium]|nr:hypothetical protein [Microscillaceae bacterium]
MFSFLRLIKYRNIFIHLLGLLILTHLLVLYTQFLLARGQISRFQYYWDTPFWLLIVCGISILFTWVVYQKVRKLQKQGTHYFPTLLISTLLFMITTNGWFLMMENIVFSKPLNYNALIVSNLLFLIIHLVVGNTFLSYYSLKKLHQTQTTLLKTQKAASEYQLEQLKQQISPHFLFNNLNVLSSLIHTNTDTADLFLEKFSGLYRYILQSNNQELVPLSQELSFIQDYMFLIEQRFERSYQLSIPAVTFSLKQFLIVPTTLQQLIENAIKHNEALPDHPLVIEILVSLENIQITNERRPKKYPATSTQTGLKNIHQQYRLLSQQEVQITQTSEKFTVVLPLIKLDQAL